MCAYEMGAKLIIIDADILSMFAKTDTTDVLVEFLGREHTATTPAIVDELSVPLQHGYTFPLRIFSHIPVVSVNEQVRREYRQMRAKEASLGRGELEAIAFCKIREALFATNDLLARKFAQKQGVNVISLQAILRGLWMCGVRSKAEVREILEQIKKVDRLKVSPEVEAEIFDPDMHNE